MSKITIEFNTKMKTDFNISTIDSTIIDMYIEPDKHREQEETVDHSLLNFTWTAVSFEGNLLIFKLEFKNPAEISPSLSQDWIVVHFKQIEGIFISSEYLVDLTSDNSTLREKITKQISEGPFTEGLVLLSENLEAGLKGAFIAVFVLNIFVSGVMNQLVGTIRSL
jgi:hypothetical protein